MRRRFSREDAKEREEREDDDKMGYYCTLLLTLRLFAFLRVFARISSTLALTWIFAVRRRKPPRRSRARAREAAGRAAQWYIETFQE
jgi:hypothetical protein